MHSLIISLAVVFGSWETQSPMADPHDVVIDTDRLAQLPGRSTCVKSLSELGTLLVKVAFKNYNLFKADKGAAAAAMAAAAVGSDPAVEQPKSPKPLSRRPSRIRRKISVWRSPAAALRLAPPTPNTTLLLTVCVIVFCR